MNQPIRTCLHPQLRQSLRHFANVAYPASKRTVRGYGMESPSTVAVEDTYTACHYGLQWPDVARAWRSRPWAGVFPVGVQGLHHIPADWTPGWRPRSRGMLLQKFSMIETWK